MATMPFAIARSSQPGLQGILLSRPASRRRGVATLSQPLTLSLVCSSHKQLEPDDVTAQDPG